jgi:hypothetical protein
MPSEEEIKEQQEERAKAAAEIWETDETPGTQATPKPPEEKETKPSEPTGEEGKDDESTETPQEDAWEGVSPGLRKTLETIQSTVESGIGSLDQRLKSAEGRIGAMHNDYYNSKQKEAEAAKKKAEEDANKPTPEELEETERSKKALADLKESDPELYNAITGTAKSLDAKVKALEDHVQQLKDSKAELEKKQAEGSLTQKETNSLARIERLEAEIQLSDDFPGWKKTIVTDEYKTWLEKQPDDIKKLTASSKVEDAATVLKAYGEAKKEKPKKSAAEINAEKEARLKASETTQTSRGKVNDKGFDDLPPEEQRRVVWKQIEAEET